MSSPDPKFSFRKRWLEMIPDPKPSGLPWVGGLVVTAMIGAYAWSFGVAKADNPAPESESSEFADADMAGSSDTESGDTAAESPADDQDEITPAATAPKHDAPIAEEPPALERKEPQTRAPRARPKRVPPPLTAAQARRAKRAASELRDAMRAGSVVVAPTVFAKVLEVEGTQWQEASASCRDLEVDGVTGWRLPSRAEMPELGGRIPSTSFWTRTRSYRDSDSVWVYDTARRRAAVWLDQEPTGATVCVQPRPRQR